MSQNTGENIYTPCWYRVGWSPLALWFCKAAAWDSWNSYTMEAIWSLDVCVFEALFKTYQIEHTHIYKMNVFSHSLREERIENLP